MINISSEWFSSFNLALSAYKNTTHDEGVYLNFILKEDINYKDNMIFLKLKKKASRRRKIKKSNFDTF